MLDGGGLMSRLFRFIRAAAPAVGTDRELLDRFARDRDEEAFALIVRRYSGSVWAACRRLADCDAEDAFQAVFLTLARKAGSVSGSLPAWLHGVARRTAANLRRSARRRSIAEATAARSAESRTDDVTFREGLAVLDEELARLPERYRAVLIVCCLEGRSRDEAAAQLGWSEGRVKGYLERARQMLRARLVRRGIELGGLLLAATVPGPAPAIPSSTVLLAGHAVSPAALSLSHGVLQAMMMQKIAVVVTVLVATAVAGAVAYRTAGAGTTPNTPVIAAQPAVAEEPPVKELNRWEKRLRDKNLTAKERAAYEQLAKLHTVKLQQWDHRGSIAIPSLGPDSELPTDVLYRMGVDVLPVLAEALDDETPTATVTDNRGRDRKVWKVNELVGKLVWRIADRDFVVGEPNKEVSVRDVGDHPKAIPEIRKLVVDWHAKYASKTPAERRIADITDSWFRNRMDAVIWLGENKAKEGRRAIEARVDGYYDDPKRSIDSTSRAEMADCALALGQIGDQASLPQVRRVCEDMSYTVYMAYRPKEQGRWAVGSAMNQDLFRAYRGLTLLGKKNEAIKELNHLLTEYGAEMEESTRKDFEKSLAEAKGF
jgi:RNA polymerase sigma factor (sigma-70 family)